jgi:hypothetical protein
MVMKSGLQILANLHVFSIPEYENVVFGISYVCMVMALASA